MLTWSVKNSFVAQQDYLTLKRAAQRKLCSNSVAGNKNPLLFLHR
jgi:hypothetical protein